MSFWKKLFGFEKLPKPEIDKSQPSATSDPQPHSVGPKSPAPSKPTLSQSLPVVTGDQSESILEAAQKGDCDKVKMLLKDNPDLVLSKDERGFTPLHLAASGGCKVVAELLLTNKADVNAKNNDGRTPLHEAAFGRKDLVDVLLAKKADINAKANNGKTPLRIALDNYYDDVAELLRQHGGTK